jgi:hypothetical protein
MLQRDHSRSATTQAARIFEDRIFAEMASAPGFAIRDASS